MQMIGTAMNLFVSLDSNYIHPLCVMLSSLAATNGGNSFDIYVAYSSLTEDDFAMMKKALGELDARIHRVPVDEEIFSGAPVLNRLSKATYYRLLIGEILPESVDRLLYLDPDIVINRDLSEFYNTDLGDNVIAGCGHLYGFNEFVNLARLCIKRTKQTRYVNAGVLLIDLKKWREAVTVKQILAFIQKNIRILFLADQDVINVLFAGRILSSDERLYNLDEKTLTHFEAKSAGNKRIDIGWIKDNTVIIHFNGKHKPWNEPVYKGKLGEFYEKNKTY